MDGDPENAAGPRTRAHGLWNEVLRDLQTAIVVGELNPRERLVEDEIIARSGATRHAVRRAFDELVRLGLVIKLPNRGVRVRDYTLDEIADIYEIRACLERQAAARFELPADASLIKELRQIAEAHARVSRQRQFAELFELNNRFHDTLYRGAGNASLAEAIRRYTVMTHPIRGRAFPDEGLREKAIEDHQEMIERIASGDREGLEKLVVEHIMRPMRFYVDHALAAGNH